LLQLLNQPILDLLLLLNLPADFLDHLLGPQLLLLQVLFNRVLLVDMVFQLFDYQSARWLLFVVLSAVELGVYVVF
jgi:hypothetical protein